MSAFSIDDEGQLLSDAAPPLRGSLSREHAGNGDLLRLRLGGRDWGLQGLEGCQGPGRDFLIDLEGRLTDALDAATANEGVDLIEIHPASGGGTWIYGVFSTDGPFELRAMLVHRPNEISGAYAEPRNVQAAQDIKRLQLEFAELAHGIFDGLPASHRRPLRVKVHSDEHWIMRFPLPMFVQMGLGSFANYLSCQWIVTERTFVEVAALQQEAERRLRDSFDFLRSSRVLINTYKAHASSANAAQLQVALSLVLQILEGLQHVALLEGGEVSLRWSLNPSPNVVADILLDGSTRFIFANFEARGGVWTTGDDTVDKSVAGVVDLTELKGRLTHILLLRIFHCHSLYSPFREDEDPVTARTLGHALLETGAAFVEGSVTEEPQIGYYCMLLQTLLGRGDIRMLLRLQAVQLGLDYDEILKAANRILMVNGCEVVEETALPFES